MKIFKVGGSIRDFFLKKTPHDHDYVVVGATPSEMESMGYKQVGKDFPVYLHPDTGEEYALARTERKTGLKHTDFDTVFDTSVTIETDLARRDLTINSIAQDLETGEYIDPFNGIQDIENKVLRHTTEAFKEDPLRVLRLGRFCAKFPDFEVADDTDTMVNHMIARGELEHLSKDRVWEETKKAVLSKEPFKYFLFLHHVEALQYAVIGGNMITAEFAEAFKRITESTEKMPDDEKLLCRMAVVYYHLGTLYKLQYQSNKAATAELNTWKIPTEIAEFIQLVNTKAYALTHTIFNYKNLVEIMDDIGVRNRIQKNDSFLQNLGLVCNAIYPTKDMSATYDPEWNIKHFIEHVPCYFDTKEALAEWMDVNKHATGKEINDRLKLIRIQNMFLNRATL